MKLMLLYQTLYDLVTHLCSFRSLSVFPPAATARTLSYAVAGGVVGSIYCKVTQETTLLKIQLPYVGKRGFEDSLR